MSEKKIKDKIRIGILRGGAGDHYHSSLRKGGDTILHFHENLSGKYKPVDILVDKDGVWHLRGMPIEPEKLLYKVDAVWNASHPTYSNILHSHSIKSIGVPAFSHAFSESREKLRERMQEIDLPMPRHILLPVYQADFDGEVHGYIKRKAREIFEKFGAPWIVKSFTPDTNMGIHLAKTFPELVEAIRDGVHHKKSLLIEEFISGKVAPVHSVATFRENDVYVFPPGNFSKEEKDKLISLAKDLHKHINAGHYLRSDFLLTSRGKVYLLGFEPTPDLRVDSHFSEICKSVGSKAESVVEHIIEKALS